MGKENKKKQVERAKIVINDHTYEFVLLDALHGLGVFHEWLVYIGKNVDDIAKVIRDMIAEPDKNIGAPELFSRLISGNDAFLKLREILIRVVGIQKLFELCATFLAGAKVDGEECNDLGMCTLFAKRPHEVYTALMFAVAVNYPDYFPFILQGPDTGESPSPE